MAGMNEDTDIPGLKADIATAISDAISGAGERMRDIEFDWVGDDHTLVATIIIHNDDENDDDDDD